MSSRNERDTVPFVGTMGLFRRSALTAVGGWNEWCICEDTEASLRVTRDGWSGLYIPRCFGRGVVPPSFAGMLTQRHRWCFGAMQIFRLHWRSLMPWDRSPDNHLTRAQRRDYLMASLGWFRDLLMLAFSLLLLVITGLLVTHSSFVVSPMDGARSLLPLSLIIVATITMLWTLRLWTTMSYRRALLSLVISLRLPGSSHSAVSKGWPGATGSSSGPRSRRPPPHPHGAPADSGGDSMARSPSWAAGPTPGTAIPVQRFFVATPGDPVPVINAALARGQDLILTPASTTCTRPSRSPGRTRWCSASASPPSCRGTASSRCGWPAFGA